MKYVDEFRDGGVAQALVGMIEAEADAQRDYRLMEFCGGHTHAIFRFGIHDLMPENVTFIHGPGCPVCVLPAGRIEAMIQLLEREKNLILCTYADLMRVPAEKGDSLQKAKARGADIRMVYSVTDALGVAQANKEKQVIFFAIGFETTTPPSAVVLKIAKGMGLKNFTLYCNHVQTVPAMAHLLGSSDASMQLKVDGILGPSHVSTVIGSDAYAACCAQYRMPMVVAGFEPLDVLLSSLMLIRQINANRTEVENQYSRAVTAKGNSKAQALMGEVFEVRAEFEWRGLGVLPESALQIREAYADFDTERRFAMDSIQVEENRGCICPVVLRGEKTPQQCPLFATLCTPENPKGACMVSSEGACAAYYAFGRYRSDV